MNKIRARAEALEQSGRLQEALAAMEEASHSSEEADVDVLVEIGRLQMVLGLLPQAEATLRRALAVDDDSAMARFFLGFVLYEAKRPTEAIQYLEAGLARREWARARTVLGAISASLGHVDEARRHYEMALQQDESNAETWYSLALTLRDSDPVRAADLLARAVDIDPSSASARRELGYTEWSLGNLDAAERHFRGALELSGDDAWAHTYLGMLLSTMERPAEAEVSNRAAVRLMPDEPLPLCNLGDSLAQQGDWRGAESSYLRALNLDVHHYLPNLRLGQLMNKRGRPGKARVYFKRVLKADPGNTTAIAGINWLDRPQRSP